MKLKIFFTSWLKLVIFFSTKIIYRMVLNFLMNHLSILNVNFVIVEIKEEFLKHVKIFVSEVISDDRLRPKTMNDIDKITGKDMYRFVEVSSLDYESTSYKKTRD